MLVFAIKPNFFPGDKLRGMVSSTVMPVQDCVAKKQLKWVHRLSHSKNSTDKSRQNALLLKWIEFLDYIWK